VRGIKRQCGCRKWQFLVLSLIISLEALVVRPTLLYSRPIIQSQAAFTLTPIHVTLSDRERSFYVKFCFVLSSKVAIACGLLVLNGESNSRSSVTVYVVAEYV